MEDLLHFDRELRQLQRAFQKLGIYFCDKRTQSNEIYRSILRSNCESAAWHLERSLNDAVELGRSQKHLSKRLPKATRDALQADILKRAIAIYDRMEQAKRAMELSLKNPVATTTVNKPIVEDALADLVSVQSRMLALGTDGKTIAVQLQLTDQDALI